MSARGAKRERCVVYTAIAGHFDRLLRPSYSDEDNLKYVCFSDSRLLHALGGPSNWEIRRMPASRLDDVRRAKEFKVLPHRMFPDYDVSIWIDGNVDIIGDIQSLVEASRRHPFLALRHPERDCAYAEAAECIRLGKDQEPVIRRQMERYRREGLPENYGLIEANVLIRRHNEPQVIKLMEAWWEEIRSGSRRDQLSFPYVAWKLGFTYATLGDQSTRGTSAYFRTRWGGGQHARETRASILRSFFQRRVLWRLPRARRPKRTTAGRIASNTGITS